MHARRDSIIIFGTALAVRVAAFLVQLARDPSLPFPMLDSQELHEWARAIAHGDFLGHEVFFRGPVYPYLLALVYRLGGDSIAVAIALQHVIGAATCVTIFFLARYFHERRVALTAGLLAALYWPFIYFEGELLIATLFTFLCALTLWALARAQRAGTARACAIAGACLGLATITRPNLFVFWLAVPVVVHAADGGRWRRTVITIATAALVVLPVTLRNYKVGGEAVLVASSGGVNFYIGNNETADGRTAIVPGSDAPWMGGNAEAVEIAEKLAGRSLKPGEVSDFYYRRGAEFVVSHPLDAAALFVRKIFLFWEGPERSNEKYIYFFWKRSGLGNAPLPGFWLIAPLALASMFFGWRERRRQTLLYVFAGVWMLTVALFFVHARFRLPVAVVLIIFAADMVWRLAGAFRRRSEGRFARTVLVTVLLFFVVNASYPSFLRSRAEHEAISHYTLASSWLQAGKRDRALAEYERARIAFEKHPSESYAIVARDIYNKLGGLYWERGNCAGVIDALSRTPGDDEKSLAAGQLLGACLEKTGRIREALDVYHAVLHVQPGNAAVRAGLARCFEALGRYDEARKVRAGGETE